MAGNVSTSSSAINGGIRCCKKAIDLLSKSAQKLDKKYKAAGENWDDNKYAQLGVVVGECKASMMEPVNELSECIENLNKLLKEVSAYENLNI